MSLPSRSNFAVTNAAPKNSRSDRGFSALTKEVAAQKSVSASVETLLIGIGQMVKEGHYDGDTFDRQLNVFIKPICEACVHNTAAALSQDTTRQTVEITGARDISTDESAGTIEHDPKTTPGAIPSEAKTIPRDLPEVLDGTIAEKQAGQPVPAKAA